MTFEEATRSQEALEAVCSNCSRVMQAFPKGRMNLTPEHVKATVEWKAAYKKSREAFAALREFNQFYVKTFAVELKAMRAQKLLEKQKALTRS